MHVLLLKMSKGHFYLQKNEQSSFLAEIKWAGHCALLKMSRGNTARPYKNNSDVRMTMAGNWRFISYYFMQLLNKFNLKNTIQCIRIYKQCTG